jgi:hypothetical protein
MSTGIDWINIIIEELVNPEYKLSETILKVKILESRVKSEKLKTWVEDEINGYNDKEVPEYRDLDVGLFGDLIQDRGFSGILTSKAVPLPTEHLPEEIKEIIRKTPLRVSISELEDMSKSKEDFKIDIPYSLFPYFRQGLANNWNLSAAWRLVPKSKIQGILTKIKSKLIDFLTEISEEMGENENLSILKGKHQVDHIFDHTIGKVSGRTVNISIGSDNLQQMNVGKHSTSNVAVGNNINQSISQDFKQEIGDFLKLLEDKLDQISLDQNDKEDIRIESSRVNSQLQREKPKVGIIQNSLRVIEGILLGVTANALTQPILETLNALLSNFF